MMAAKFTSRRAKRGVIDATGDDRPTPKDLYNHIVLQAAVKWRDLGVQLLNPPSESVLDIIKANNPQNVKECCKSVLRKWLDTKPDASWDQLLEALRSPCIELNHLADQIEHKMIPSKKSTEDDKKYISTSTLTANISCTNRLSSSDLYLINKRTEKRATPDMVQNNNNQHSIPDSLPVSHVPQITETNNLTTEAVTPCLLQVTEDIVTNNRPTEAMTQHPLALQYGSLNVTDSTARPHLDDEVYSDNKASDVHPRQPQHVDDISASPQPTQLPTEDAQCRVTNASEHLGNSMVSLPSTILQQQQPVPPMPAHHHGFIPVNTTSSWSNYQHKQQNPINMGTVSTSAQQNLSYQNNGRGNPSTPSMMHHQNNGDFYNPNHHISQIPSPNPQLQHHHTGPKQPGEMKGKKVFILHYVADGDDFIQAVESLAAFLREIGVDISIDLFEKDPGTVENWSIWCEDEILSSDVVLCIITPNFNSEIKKVSIYNLMSDQKAIAFRAVFLDSPVVKEYIPLSMRGSTFYCISSQCLNLEDDGFASLYALLTGQNRLEKPPVGRVLRLPPKRSKFSQRQHNQPVASSLTKRNRQQKP